ncbi:MAG: hypothetical protein IID32_06365 [Planctomycetes bacterium]|nr:hypothetical protein [Planctomycetota bacterium]
MSTFTANDSETLREIAEAFRVWGILQKGDGEVTKKSWEAARAAWTLAVKHKGLITDAIKEFGIHHGLQKVVVTLDHIASVSHSEDLGSYSGNWYDFTQKQASSYPTFPNELDRLANEIDDQVVGAEDEELDHQEEPTQKDRGMMQRPPQCFHLANFCEFANKARDKFVEAIRNSQPESTERHSLYNIFIPRNSTAGESPSDKAITEARLNGELTTLLPRIESLWAALREFCCEAVLCPQGNSLEPISKEFDALNNALISLFPFTNIESDSHTDDDTETGKTRHFELDCERQRVFVKKRWYQLTVKCTEMLTILAAAKGSWVGGKTINGFNGRPDKILKRMPKTVQSIIETSQHDGYRIKPLLFA